MVVTQDLHCHTVIATRSSKPKNWPKVAPQTLPRSVPKMRLRLTLTSRNPNSALWDAPKSASQSRLEPAFQSRLNLRLGFVFGNANRTRNGTQKLALTSRNPCQAKRFRAPKTAATQSLPHGRQSQKTDQKRLPRRSPEMSQKCV